MDHSPTRKRFEALCRKLDVQYTTFTPRVGLDLMVELCNGTPGGALQCCWDAAGPDFSIMLHLPYDDTPPEERDDGTLTLTFRFPMPSGIEETLWALHIHGEDITGFREKIQSWQTFRRWGDSPEGDVTLDDQTIDRRTYLLASGHQGRSPWRPATSMTEAEWLQSEDVPKMLRWFRQGWPGTEADLDRLLHPYYLACCRRIWPLLRAPETRRAVEVVEQNLQGHVPPEDFAHIIWQAEGTMGYFDEELWVDGDSDDVMAAYNAERRIEVDRMVREVEAIPRAEWDTLIRSTPDDTPMTTIQILKQAAGFAYLALWPGGTRPRERKDRYPLFLDAPLLREMVGNPFR